MLSRVTLQFSDPDMKAHYVRDKEEFYIKALPVITLMLFIMALTLEVLYRALDLGDINGLTSALNWGSAVIFLGLCFLLKRVFLVTWVVCPLLTLLAYYYFAFIDFQRDAGVIYYT